MRPVRALCAWALFQTGDEVDEPVQVTIELLQSDDLNARFEAAMYLVLAHSVIQGGHFGECFFCHR